MASNVLIFECLALLIGASGLFLMKVNKIQNSPYMDEIFHIHQLQQYCQGNYYYWDAKITTLPGVYILTYLYLLFVSRLFSFDMDKICSTFYIRIFNVLVYALNFTLIYFILKQLNDTMLKKTSPNRLIVNSLKIAILPVLFFFSALYYTDQSSLAFVLMMYLSHLYKFNHVMTSILGLFSILMRQTNIIWVLFILGLRIEQTIHSVYKFDNFTQLFKKLLESPILFMKLILETLLNSWCLFLVHIIFLIFVIYNNGIVVGDRSAHVVVLHIPQMFYFVSFCSLLSFPKYLVNLNKLVKRCNSKFQFLILFSVTSLIFLLCIHLFTHEHPYLLADNRHYTFYLWKRIYQRHWTVKYLLSPLYVTCFYHFCRELRYLRPLQLIGFVICTSATLITTQLLEFRYFIVPYVLWRLQSPVSKRWYYLVPEIVFAVIINAFTVYMFLYKAFSWPNDYEPIQRFMW